MNIIMGAINNNDTACHPGAFDFLGVFIST